MTQIRFIVDLEGTETHLPAVENGIPPREGDTVYMWSGLAGKTQEKFVVTRSYCVLLEVSANPMGLFNVPTLEQYYEVIMRLAG